MRKLTILILSVVFISFYSCEEKQNCDDIDCVNPAGSLFIELIDSQTEVNVFAAGILNDSSHIVIVNGDFESQKYTLLKESYMLELPDITKVKGPEAYQIIIRNDYIVSFQLNMQTETAEDCCKDFFVSSFKVSSVPYEFSKKAITAKIYVNLE